MTLHHIPVLDSGESLTVSTWDHPDAATVALEASSRMGSTFIRLDLSAARELRAALDGAITAREAQEAVQALRPLEVSDVVVLKGSRDPKPPRRVVIGVNNDHMLGDLVDVVQLDPSPWSPTGRIIRSRSARSHRRLTDEEQAAYDV